MPRFVTPPAVLPLSAIALVACGDAADVAPDAVRTDSAGVEIVVSPAEDRPLGWIFEEEFRLGGDDEGPAMFTSVNLDEVGTDAEGNLYVLDRQSHRVVVFGPDGSHLRSMGSEGEGPGELRFPVSFAVRGDGTAAVFDIGKGSMVPFGPDGEPLAQDPFSHYTEPGTLRHFALTPVGYAVARGISGTDDQRGIDLVAWPEPALFEPASAADQTSPDTAVLAELRFPRPDPSDFGCMQIVFQPLFTPVIQWDTDGTTVVAVDGIDYTVDVYDLDGMLLRSVRRDLPVRPATEADAVAEAGPGLRMRSSGGGCAATPEEVVEERGFASELPAIRNVLLAPSGEIWVERFVPGSLSSGAPAPVDVFDAGGAYVGTLPEGRRFPLLILPDGRVVTDERDAFDVERLVVWRVDRGPAPDL